MKRLIKFAWGGNTRTSFNQMFKTARKAGMKYFNFNGKKYSTKYDIGENKDTAWEKLKDNAYDIDTGVNSFMIPTEEEAKRHSPGLELQNTSPKTDENIPRQYNNEFEQATQGELPITTKTIPGEWQPVLPEADRADFRDDDEYKYGYIDPQYRYNTKTGKYYYDMTGNEPDSVYRALGYKDVDLTDRETYADWYKDYKEQEGQDMRNYYEQQDKENGVRQGNEDGSYAFSYLRAQNEKDGGKIHKKLISKRK